MDYKTILLSPNGRINRKVYWLTSLAVGAALMVAWMIAGGITAVTMPAEGGVSAIAMIFYVIAGVVSLMATWTAICLHFKRCHDRDFSGWMILIPFYNIWVSIQVYFLPGTPGPNRFGPDPLGTPVLTYAPA
jgi:uncharacterized membrane protein YhaH (DUF805 family)